LASLWVAEIVPNCSWLDSLCNRSSGFDVRLWREEEDSCPPSYFWASPHLDVLDDFESVMHRAAGLRALWHGALFVTYGLEYSPLRLNYLHRENHRNVPIEEGDPLSFPFASELLQRSWQRTKNAQDPMQDQTDILLALARYDEGARHRLQALGNEGPTNVSLFRLYDDMKRIQKWSDTEIDQQGDAEEPVTQRFRATANNPLHSGAASRHGGSGSPPMSKKPTDIREAGPIILEAYRKYLNVKARELDLESRVSEGNP
jgi:hypothetical protein